VPDPQNRQDGGDSYEELKMEFETAMDRLAMQGLQAEAILGCIIPYRDFIKQNLAETGQIPPSAFVRWMESADRTDLGLPDELGENLLRTLDEILIRAVREHQYQPRAAADALDEWVEESKEKFQEMHGIEGEFPDVE
jgi:hypothetical protein